MVQVMLSFSNNIQTKVRFNMRLFNKTSYKTVETIDLLNEQKHLINALIDVRKANVKSIEFTDDKTALMGVDVLVAEFNPNKDLKVKGIIRWWDKTSKEGMIRLDSGMSCWLYASNVIGADSAYPHLVTNVQFEAGDAVEGVILADQHIFKNCGITQVRKAA